MGCASSGPLPFLSNRGNEAMAEPSLVNGELPYEVKTAKDSLGMTGVENVGEDISSGQQMMEAVDSTVQNVADAVVQKKNEIVDQVEGLGDAIADKLTSAADSVHETLETAFDNLTGAVDTLEDKLTTEAKSMAEHAKSVLVPAAADEMKAEDIDELLESLPTEAEVAEVGAAAAAATEEEVADERKTGNED